METRSLEIKYGIGTTSDAHLNAKFEVQNIEERDSLILTKSIKQGHIIYNKSDNKHYYLKVYPVPGSLEGVVWGNLGAVGSNSLDSDSEETLLTSKGAKALKDLIDNITFLDPNFPPVFIDGSDSDNYKDSLRFTFVDGNVVDVSIKDLVDLGAFKGAERKTESDFTVNFLTLGGQTVELNMNPWFNLKLGVNDTALNSLKLGGFSVSHFATSNSLITGLATKENIFSKNTAFNKDFGTLPGTVAEGNDSRIVQGAIAYSKKVNSLSVTGTTNKTLTLTLQDGSTLSTTFSDIDTSDPDLYLNGLNFNINTGNFVAVLNDSTTSSVNLDGRYSLLGHAHDDRYYIKSSVDLLLTTKYDSSNFGKLEIEALNLDYFSLSNKPVLYTTGDFNFDFSTKSTDNLLEGSTNLYFTSTRVTNIITQTYVNNLGINAITLGGNLPSYYAVASEIKNLGSHNLSIPSGVTTREFDMGGQTLEFVNGDHFYVETNNFHIDSSNLELYSSSIFIGANTPRGSISITNTGIDIVQGSSATDNLRLTSPSNIILKNTGSTGYVFVDSSVGLISRYYKVGTPTGFSGLITGSFTSDRSFTLPNKSGTLLVTSDLTDGLATKENVFTKNTGFNKNFGTSAGTVAEGNDSRFTKAEEAWDESPFSLAVSSGLNKTITLTLRDGSTISANFEDIDTIDPDVEVTGVSFNSGTGLLTIVNSDLTQVSTNLDNRWSLLGHTHSFSSLTSIPDSIAGYGILDAYNITQVDTLLSGKVNNSRVLTDVPLGAIFTDTTYSIGDGGLTEKNFTTSLYNKLVGIGSNIAYTNLTNSFTVSQSFTNIRINSGSSIAGALFTIAKTSTVSSTDVVSFIDLNRNNTTVNAPTAEIYGQVVRSQSNSSFEDNVVVGANLIGRKLGSGKIGGLYGSLNVGEYNGTGLVDFLSGTVSRSNVIGSGVGTVDYVRGIDIYANINNANATVNYAQGTHITTSLSNGTVGRLDILYLDFDYDNTNAGTTSVTGDFSYISSNNDTRPTILGNSYFINSLTELPSRFSGKITAPFFEGDGSELTNLKFTWASTNW